MKKYFSDLMQEISNCIFILKLSWNINKTFFFIKIPLLVMGVISSFFPLIFLRLILNEIQEGKDIKKVLYYAGGYAGALLCINLANNLLGMILDRQTKKTVYRTQEFLGKTVMQLSYSDLDAAMKLGLEMTLEHLNRQGAEVSPESREALVWLNSAK